ncbi:hypothetical protein [Brumimicrobium aurantiacum]|uniref:hypothetical protein n=1 Tax=Brumimicrobium aurantiacum TaxID=1737063 RepID=UPI000F514AB9|nr:hypothetical protein [Brumimicrobium aurantiacum]
MGIILIAFYTLLFLWLTYSINKKHILDLPVYTLPGLFLVKIGFALFFLYVYTYHYGGGELTADAGMFFNESRILHDVFYASPKAFFQFLFGLNNDPELINKYLEATSHWNGGDRFLPNDSRHILRINALLYFISNGEVFIHFLFFSFASFMGGVDVFQWLKKKSNIPQWILLVALTLAPSLAFWSSSIIKEPLMIFGLFILIRALFDNLSPSRRLWRIIIGLLLTVSIKPYALICLLAALIYHFIFSRLFKNLWLSLSFYLALGISILAVSGYGDKIAYIIANQQEDFINLRDGGLYLNGDDKHYYYIYHSNRDHFEFKNNTATLIEPVGAYYMKKNENFERFPMQLNEVGKTYSIYLSLAKTGSKVDVTLIKDDYWQMIKNIPEAIYNSFVQPIPNRKSTWLQYPAFIENILFIILFIMSFVIYPRSLNQSDKRILITLSLFGAFVAMIVGWTTPVSGAIVRYIIPAHIAILILLAMKLDYKKLKQKWIKGSL